MQLDLRIFCFFFTAGQTFDESHSFLHHVILIHVPIISPKNVSNLPTSRTGSRRDGRPLDRGWECILLLWRILWMTWYKSILSSGGNRRQSWVPHSSSISWNSKVAIYKTKTGETLQMCCIFLMGKNKNRLTWRLPSQGWWSYRVPINFLGRFLKNLSKVFFMSLHRVKTKCKNLWS